MTNVPPELVLGLTTMAIALAAAIGVRIMSKRMDRKWGAD